MKKVFLFIVLIILAIGLLLYAKKLHAPEIVSTTATYKNTTTGLQFTYPKILTVTTEDGIADIQHSIPFIHHDYCDFKGEGTTTIPTLTDLHVTMHTRDLGLVETMKAESSYIPAENFVNDQVVASPGFIDPYTVGKLSGYKIFEGAEGCGHMIYYFPLSNSQTLVVIEDWVTIFSGAIDQAEGAKALLVPGVISKEKESDIFTSILGTVSVN